MSPPRSDYKKTEKSFNEHLLNVIPDIELHAKTQRLVTLFRPSGNSPSSDIRKEIHYSMLGATERQGGEGKRPGRERSQLAPKTHKGC